MKRNTEIRTFSGITIDPLRATPDQIKLEDIAHALSMVCRYGGHCPKFFSVAEHSLIVSWLAGLYSPELSVAGLLHDAEEAYLLDMPSPIKWQFKSYVKAGDRLRRTIFEKFGVDYSTYKEVKRFDEDAYLLEREHLWKGRKTMLPEEAELVWSENAKELGLGKETEVRIPEWLRGKDSSLVGEGGNTLRVRDSIPDVRPENSQRDVSEVWIKGDSSGA